MTNTTETRAKQTLGSSSDAVYHLVGRALESKLSNSVLIDVGCGICRLHSLVGNGCDRYLGVDVVRYDGLPAAVEFVPLDLDQGRVPLNNEIADVVVAVEVIEHLENPRAFVRELVRLTKPGGLVVVTTPNNLSLLSKLTLVLRNQFNAFQEAPGLYPAHITALLEIDLIRIFKESGLTGIKTMYSNVGRMPFTPWHWPSFLNCKGRLFSDNFLTLGIKT